jgi:pantothenate kinase
VKAQFASQLTHASRDDVLGGLQKEDVGNTPSPYHKIKDLLQDGDEVDVQLKVTNIYKEERKQKQPLSAD